MNEVNQKIRDCNYKLILDSFKPCLECGINELFVPQDLFYSVSKVFTNYVAYIYKIRA